MRKESSAARSKGVAMLPKAGMDGSGQPDGGRDPDPDAVGDASRIQLVAGACPSDGGDFEHAGEVEVREVCGDEDEPAKQCAHYDACGEEVPNLRPEAVSQRDGHRDEDTGSQGVVGQVGGDGSCEEQDEPDDQRRHVRRNEAGQPEDGRVGGGADDLEAQQQEAQ